MASIGEITAKLSLDTASFEKSTKKAQSSLEKLSTKFVAIGGVMSAAITAPLIASGISAVNLASDAEETRNKFSQVFGDMAGDAESFADRLADSLGRYKPDILDSLAAFQSMGVGLGMSSEEANNFSQRLSELSIDFASFNNISDAEAQQRFIAALSGSSEVLDQFGVNIKQSALDAQLLENGFPTIAQGATETEKAIARLSIIEDTMGQQGAIGDAARTSDSFANKSKKMQSRLKELGETVGKALLPDAERIVDVITKLATAFSNMSPFLRTFTLLIVGVMGAIGPLLLALGTIMQIFSVIGPIIAAVGLGPISLIIGIIVALIAVIALLVTHWETIKKVVGNVISWIVDFIKKHYQILLAVFFGPMGIAIGLIIKNFDSIKEAVTNVFNNVKEVLGKMKDFAVGVFDDIVSKIKEFFDMSSSVGSTLLNALKELIKKWIIDPFNNFQIDVGVGKVDLPDLSIPGFEKGGIVGGTSFSGDKILAGVNSGEEVVTQNDRQTLKEFMSGLVNKIGSDSGKVVNITIEQHNAAGVPVEQLNRNLFNQLKRYSV